MWIACCPGNLEDYLLLLAIFCGGWIMTGLAAALLIRLTRLR